MKQKLKSLQFRILLPAFIIIVFVVTLMNTLYSRAYIRMILQQEVEHAALRFAARVGLGNSGANIDTVHPAPGLRYAVHHPRMNTVQVFPAHDSPAYSPLVRNDIDSLETTSR